MELHHHPAEKKKFKEYLLEGLMIFIAVTMGFFAESLREHIGENHKEHEYIHSLYGDLKQDSVAFKNTLKENYYKLRWLDSVLTLTGKNLNDVHNRQLLYRYSSNGISYYSAFGSNDATMTQLKSAGGLQYIRRGHLADSIARYDQEMRSIYGAEGNYGKTIEAGMNAMARLLVYSIFKDSTYFKKGDFTDKMPPLLSTDANALNLFFNQVSMERGWTINYIQNLEERVPYNSRLMALLKEEYNIEE